MFFTGFLPAQSIVKGRQPYFKNYSVIDGLTSETVYQCIEDSLGRLWFATARGISMYDGKKFTGNFQINQLTGRTVFGFHKDYSGKIWCYTFTGEIGYLEGDNWYGIAANEELVRRYGGKVIGSMHVNKDNSILLGYKEHSINGLVKIEDFSRVSELSYNVENHIFSKPLKNKEVWSRRGLSTERIINYEGVRYDFEKLFYDFNSIIYIRSGNRDFIIIDSLLTRIGNGNIERIYKSKAVINSLTFVEEDNTYFLSLLGNGLIHIKDGVNHHYFKNETIYYSYKDMEGGWWICSAKNGVYYWHPTQPIFIGLGDEYTKIIPASDSGFYLKNDFDVRCFSLQDSLRLQYEYRSEEILTSFKKTDNFLFFLNKKNEVDIYSKKHEFLKRESPFSFYDILDDGEKIVTGYFGVRELNFEDLSIIRTTTNTDRVIAIEKSDDLVYAGTLSGLSIYQKGELRKLDSIPELYHKQINLIENFRDGLVLGVKGSGLIWWNRSEKEPEVILHITSGKFVKKIDYINDSTLLVVSEIGVEMVEYLDGKFTSRISYSSKVDFVDAIALNNEILVLSKDKLFISRQKEVTDIQLPTIAISNFKVNNIKRSLKEKIELAAGENNLEIEFNCFSPAYSKELKYYYRVNRSDWKALPNAKLNLYELAPDNYQIEVKANFSEEVSSDILKFTINILPPIYERWWFITLLSLMVVMVSFLWGKYHAGHKQKLLHEKLLRQKAQLNAVQAQINPHFLFNVFNSIQYLVLKERTKEALQSMSRFSKLMRMALNHSKYEFVQLNHEIRFLLLYVELENLRLDYEVELQFEVDDNVNLKVMMIPPLLLQILIENAMWHGLQSIKEDRELILRIKKDGDLLRIEVVDNGIGIEQSKENKSQFGRQRKSIGTSLIKEKLEILEKLYNVEGMGIYYRETYPHLKNKGTTVQLNIMYRESL